MIVREEKHRNGQAQESQHRDLCVYFQDHDHHSRKTLKWTRRWLTAWWSWGSGGSLGRKNIVVDEQEIDSPKGGLSGGDTTMLFFAITIIIIVIIVIIILIVMMLSCRERHNNNILIWPKLYPHFLTHDFGPFLCSEPRIMDFWPVGPDTRWVLDDKLWTLVDGPSTLDLKSLTIWTFSVRQWASEFGPWTLNPGTCILDLGPWSFQNTRVWTRGGSNDERGK